MASLDRDTLVAFDYLSLCIRLLVIKRTFGGSGLLRGLLVGWSSKRTFGGSGLLRGLLMGVAF